MNMKSKILHWGLMLFSAVLAAACAGQKDEEYDQRELTLSADVQEIIADGKSEVKFTVMYGEEDVTEAASVKCVTDNRELPGNSFSTEAVGSFAFKAFYEKAASEEVSVMVRSKFKRRVCVMEFTGAWCSQCPSGATTLDFLVSRTYKGQAFAMAFHNDDDFALPVEKKLAGMFNIDAYPSFVTDMRSVGQLNGGGCSTSIEESLYESETHCSASVTCTYDESTGKVAVDSKIYSEKDASYSLAAYVIEDMVRGEQTQADGSKDKDYVHRHVVRAMLSSDVKGDGLGNVPAGAEAGKTFDFTPDKTWNMANLTVAVLVLDENGQVNNMAVCPADGGAMGYEYIN